MYRIVPKKGLKVINPATMKRVKEDGVVVPKITTYWKRRKKDEDITITKVVGKKASKNKKEEENK